MLGRLITLAAVLAPAALTAAQTPAADEGPFVFLLTDSDGFVHGVVKPPAGDSLVRRTLEHVVEDQIGGELRHTDDAKQLNDVLASAAAGEQRRPDAVVLYTTGAIPLDVQALSNYVETGGALVGIHCATDTLKDSDDFAQLLGGTFDGHPWSSQDKVVLKSHEPSHPAAAGVGERRGLVEEIYQFRNLDPQNLRVLVSLDMEATPKKQPRHVPIVWVREQGTGRVSYTSLGHRQDVWESDWYQQHLIGLLQWTTKRVEGEAAPNPELQAREQQLAERAAEPNAAPAAALMQDQPQRPHDPWVFRVVLDKRPRSVVVALAEDMWLGYDTQSGVLFKAWSGGMNFTGSVYDDKHGPQPQSKGQVYFALPPEASWSATKNGQPAEVTMTYRGYRMDGTNSVALLYEAKTPDGTATITEMPERVGPSTLRRTFAVTDLPEGYKLSPPAFAGEDAPPQLGNGTAEVVTQLAGGN